MLKMTKFIKIISGFILVLLSNNMKADSWIDPEWKEMIDRSDAIALVEYSSNGDFRAQAKVLKIYKGNINSEFIWISGFSNRYGPIDKMRIGDKYIVFLNKNKPSKGNLNYWEEQIKEDKKLIPYVNALKKNKAYYVWTPTSGDLKVKGKKVQYDLLQTSYYSKQNFYPLKEFTEFLLATAKPDKSAFHNLTISKVKKNMKNDKSAQYLMMLYLSSYKTFNPLFKKIADSKSLKPCFALAKLLGQIKGNNSRNILINLLDNENSIVQGEAVRQLSKEDAEFIGPILLSHLNKAGEGGIYPSNIMNPVMNQVDGGKVEIIKTLGKLKYKPASKALLPLLESNNEYVFKLIVEVLQELGSKEYVPYLNKHLENGSRNLILDICYIITENELEECIPSLMRFISTHDKSIHPSMEYTISKYSGLSYFPSDTVKNFLYSDFLSVLKMKGGGTIDNKMDWVKEYIEVFTELHIVKAKKQLYNFMYEYYGFNHDFKLNPALFKLKKSKEDSILTRIRQILDTYSIQKIEVMALIEENSSEAKNYSARVKVINSDQFDTILAKLETRGVPKEKVLMTTGNYTHTHGAMEIRRFSDGLMMKFLNYLSLEPDKKDIEFMKNLKTYKFYLSDYELRKLNEVITKAEENLKE